MGSQIIGLALGRQILDHWLASEFAGGRSTSKVEKIKRLDQIRKGG
jgi:ribose 5-phosphate isomerase RpiB